MASSRVSGPQQRPSIPRALAIAALVFVVAPMVIALLTPLVASLSVQWGLYPWLDFVWIGMGGVFPLLGIALSTVSVVGYRRAQEKRGRGLAIVALVLGALEAIPMGAAAMYLISIGGWRFLI
ncbi:MAG TPA: hypothetical protein VF808_05280 [Ktedonobacterales bacterium]